MTLLLPVTVWHEIEMLIVVFMVAVILIAIFVLGAINKMQNTVDAIRQQLVARPTADNPTEQPLPPNVRPPSWAGADLKVVEGLPEEVACPKCLKPLVLRPAERRARYFVCPVCQETVDMRGRKD